MSFSNWYGWVGDTSWFSLSIASSRDAERSERLNNGIRHLRTRSVGGVAVPAVCDEANMDGRGVRHHEHAIGRGDGDGAVFLAGRRWSARRQSAQRRTGWMHRERQRRGQISSSFISC